MAKDNYTPRIHLDEKKAAGWIDERIRGAIKDLFEELEAEDENRSLSTGERKALPCDVTVEEAEAVIEDE